MKLLRGFALWLLFVSGVVAYAVKTEPKPIKNVYYQDLHRDGSIKLEPWIAWQNQDYVVLCTRVIKVGGLNQTKASICWLQEK